MRRAPERAQVIFALLLLALVAACDGTSSPTEPEGLTEPDTTTEAFSLHIRAEMGARTQAVWIHRDGPGDVAISDAVVTVNGWPIPNVAFPGYYSGQIPGPVPEGSPLELRVSVFGELIVEASGTMPEAPVVTAPATGGVIAPAGTIPVRWTSASDPDRYIVSVKDPSRTIWERELEGSARELEIDAGELPGELAFITISVDAYNDGSFSGLAHPDSRLGILSEGVPLTTEGCPLHILGGVGAQGQNINIWIHQCGLNITDGVSDAVVTVNEVAIPNVGGALYPGYYSGELPAPVPAGAPLHLRVSARGLKVEATSTVPEAPVLTSPDAGSVFAPGESIAVRWTSAVNPDRFRVYVNTNQPVWYKELPGTARELAIAASELPAGQDLVISVAAYSDGSFSGPAHPDSRMGTMAVGGLEAVRIEP